MARSVRLRTWLLIFAVATTVVGFVGKGVWDSELFDWGPEASLRSICRRWDLPMPKTVEEIDVAYGERSPKVPDDDFWMRVRLRIPPEEMPEWMSGASEGLWGMQWNTSDADTRKEASKYGCDGGATHIVPHPGQRKFGDARIFAEPEKDKIDIVWIT